MSDLPSKSMMGLAAGVISTLLLGSCAFDAPNLPDLGREKTTIAPPPSGLEPVTKDESSCGVARYEGLIGQVWDGTVQLPSGARVIRPGDMVTQDYIEERLNITLDEKDRVTRVSCG